MFKETDQNDYELRKKELDEYILNSQLCIKELADYISSSVMTLDEDELVNEEKAAEILDLEPGTLSVWRCTKRCPLKYVKIGRLIRYRRGDLRSFAASRVVG